MTKVTHPSKEELSAFNLGDLEPTKSGEIESHIEQCDQCSDTLLNLATGDTFVELLKRADAGAATDETAAAHGAALDVETSTQMPTELANHPRYRPIELLGRGGMGDVYKAEHKMMGRTVALKVINKQLVANTSAVERFHREVQAAAKISHPNIVTAFDADSAGDLHFLAMEYVDGVDLAEVIRQRGELPVTEACDFMRQAALGLQHAHEQGMVHRDIKPHNLMLAGTGDWGLGTGKTDPPPIPSLQSPAPTVKILDFGLASLVSSPAIEGDQSQAAHDSHASQLTRAGATMGTPDYISPEQADDARSADIRSDIYSLGCTFYFLLTGRPPFAGDSVVQKLEAHRQDDPESLESVRADVPAEVADVVRRMMAKDPAERFQTPAEVADALAPFVDRHRSTQPVEPKPQSRQAATLDKPNHGRRRAAWIGAICTSLIGIIALAAVIYVQTDNGTLVIKSPDPDARVIIKKNGKEVQTIEIRSFVDSGKTKSDKSDGGVRIEVNLRSGDYEVELLGDGGKLRLSKNGVTIRRGDTDLVQISKVQGDAEEAASNDRPVVGPWTDAAPLEVTGLRYISDDFIAAAVVNPQSILNKPIAASAKLALTDVFDKDLRVKMHEVAQLVLLLPTPTRTEPQRGNSEGAAIIHFQSLIDGNKTDAAAMVARFLQRPQEKKHGEATYFVDPQGDAVFVAGDQTIVSAPEDLLLKMISKDNSQSTLAKELASTRGRGDLVGVIAMSATTRGLISMAAAQLAEHMSPALSAETLAAPKNIEALQVVADFAPGGDMWVDVQTTDATAAESLAGLARANLKETVATLKRLGADAPASMIRTDTLVLRTMYQLADAAEVHHRGDRVFVSSKTPAGLADAFLSGMVMKLRRDARVAKQKNQLKEIGLALNEFHDVEASFPPSASTVIDNNQLKPLLSWRVHILPYLGDEEQALYKKFHFDEPWDSEHNIKLLDSMPDVFNTTGDFTNTTIHVIVGNGTVFDGTRGISLREIDDGTKDTILAVMAGAEKAVPWAKPADLLFNAEDPIAVLGKLDSDEFLAVFCDGHADAVSSNIRPEVLRAMITRAGDEEIDHENMRLKPARARKVNVPELPASVSDYFAAWCELVLNPKTIDPTAGTRELLWAVSNVSARTTPMPDGDYEWKATWMLEGTEESIRRFMKKLVEAKIEFVGHGARLIGAETQRGQNIPTKISIEYSAGYRQGTIEMQERSRTVGGKRLAVVADFKFTEQFTIKNAEVRKQLDQLSDASAKDREQIVERIHEMASAVPEDAMRALIRIARTDEDEDVASDATRAIAEVGEASEAAAKIGLPAMRSLMHSRSKPEDVRIGAVRAIGEIGSKHPQLPEIEDSLESLMELLERDVAKVRAQALWSIREIGLAERTLVDSYLPRIGDIVDKDKDSDVRRAALDVIKRLEEPQE